MKNRLNAVAGAFAAVLATVLLLAPAAASAQQQREFYEANPPLPTDSPGKVEVVEFFWYGCPHCYALEPSLQAWVDKLPKDVAFKRVPAIFNENWAASARVFYTLESMGQLSRLHRAFFDAIHKEGLRPASESEVQVWMKQHGVDVDQYKTISKSFSVDSRMKRAQQLIDAAKIDGVPAIVVQGRYVVLAAASPAAMLQNVDRFIAQARKDLPAAQAAELPKGNTKTAAKSAGKG